MSCELVCTGWYSTDAPRSYITYGDDEIRNNDFRPLWWKSIDSFVKPQKVLIVDSASPVKPQDASCTSTSFEYIELLRNPGHSQNCTTHYAGYMASVILGLEYALLNDVDFFLYIEQDALTYGKNFVGRIKQSLLKSDFVFGNAGARAEIEQSVFAISKRGIRKFLSALHAIEYSDRQISPEIKFMYAASGFNGIPLVGLLSWDNPLWIRRPFTRLFFQLMPLFGQYTLLPFGYGRVRPIDFNDDIFYFQQGSKEEINLYKKRSGF